MEQNNIFESLVELLNIDIKRSKVISVVGAGGKTSLIFRLTEELVSIGKRVIVATTTHMAWERRRPFALNGDIGKVRENIKAFGYTVAGAFGENANSNASEVPDEIQKFTALPAEQFFHLADECDILLIEADGAKRLPLKVPAEWEPVIPNITELVIGVIGLDCIGKPLQETCHRPELAASFLNKEASASVTEEDVFRIAASEQGLKKSVGNREFRVFLNKADTPEDKRRAQKLIEGFQKKGIRAAYGNLRQKDSLAVVLLAAGNSQRFGSNKLLYPVEGFPMYERIFQKLYRLKERCKEKLHSITVVTKYLELEKRSAELGFQCVRNSFSQEGVSSSLRLGLRASLRADACLFMVADQPWIREETIAELIEKFFVYTDLEGRFLFGKGIACASSMGEPGNPCIFSREYYPELLALRGDRGGKEVLLRHMEDAFLLEIPDKRELLDMDMQ